MGSCPACGHRPHGEERPLAWLLSGHHLGERELEEAATRIASGQPPKPSATQLARAREALDPHVEERALAEPLGGMGRIELAIMATAILLFSALPGFVAWLAWRESRPLAARQALVLAVVSAVAWTSGWLVVVLDP